MKTTNCLMMKNRDVKNLSLPLTTAVNLPATVNGINRNSPSRASIKVVLPPVIPAQGTSCLQQPNVPGSNRQLEQSQPPPPPQQQQHFYDANNYYNTKPSMQQIPEQSTISMFTEDSQSSIDVERISPGSLIDQYKYNRYSSSSLDSGRGSDSIKFTAGQCNRVSVHSCESIGSTSSNKDSESSQQSSSLSSSSSTSSSFCSSSSSSSSSNPNQYSNRTLSSSSSIVSNADNNNKGYSNMMPSNSRNFLSKQTSNGNMPNLMAQAGLPSIAEMILHGISDSEIIHNWLQKIKMGKFEKNFIDSAYDMGTIARMTPQDLIAIGITDPKSRSILTTEIQKLNMPESLPSFKPDSLEEWLKLLNLHCYYGSLCQQGYSTIDRVMELTWEDLEDVGINKLGHQKKILLAIKKVKSLKSKPIGNSNQPIDNESIYSSSSVCNDVKALPNQSKETLPTLIPPQYHPTIMSNVPATHTLPYQDVPIKMYANSPTHLDHHHPVETFTFIANHNQMPSVVMNPKPQMQTFQQMSEMDRMMTPHCMPVPNLAFPEMAINTYYQHPNQAQAMFGRGRSLESLEYTESNNYGNYSYQNVNPNSLAYKPTYQYSNGDIYGGLNRPFVDANAVRNSTFNMININQQYANQPYEIDGTATLNRPKNLIKNKPIAKIVASARQSDVYDNFDTTSLKSNESIEFKMSQGSDTSSETGSIYSTLKKKPPPPPKRVNSVRMVNSGANSPSQHRTTEPAAQFHDQIYSNQPFGIMNNDVQGYRSLTNDDVFASCVKSLTNKFSEMNSLASKDDDQLHETSTFSTMTTTIGNNTHTLPMNRKELNRIENCIEGVNVSSSSSTESMPFANDNIGTIRQKNSLFLQQALKFGDGSHKMSSSSSSSSSATSSPMFCKNVSLPNSNLNSPMAANVSNPVFHTTNIDNQDGTKTITKSDSRQNVVDSLEDIEIMLANLKTQLDSI